MMINELKKLSNVNAATITLNPAIDHTLYLTELNVGWVNRVAKERFDLGGKGINVASFLSHFGLSLTVTGFLGKNNMDIFKTFFKKKGFLDKFILVDGETRSNIKIVDKKNKDITDINLSGFNIQDSDVTGLLGLIEILSQNNEWFVLSGSLPQGVPDIIYKEIIEQLNGKNKKVVLDASGTALLKGIEAAPFIIKPNIDELNEIFENKADSIDKVVNFTKKISNKGISYVIVSMGEKGAVFTKGDKSVHVIPPRINIKSTVGAGDAMVAGFIEGCNLNLGLEECAGFSTAVAMGTLVQEGPYLTDLETINNFVDNVCIKAL